VRPGVAKPMRQWRRSKGKRDAQPQAPSPRKEELADIEEAIKLLDGKRRLNQVQKDWDRANDTRKWTRARRHMKGFIRHHRLILRSALAASIAATLASVRDHASTTPMWGVLVAFLLIASYWSTSEGP